MMYPSPILASPLNHATQSINGSLSLGTYTLYAAARVSEAGFQVDGYLSHHNHRIPQRSSTLHLGEHRGRLSPSFFLQDTTGSEPGAI